MTPHSLDDEGARAVVYRFGSEVEKRLPEGEEFEEWVRVLVSGHEFNEHFFAALWDPEGSVVFDNRGIHPLASEYTSVEEAIPFDTK